MKFRAYDTKAERYLTDDEIDYVVVNNHGRVYFITDVGLDLDIDNSIDIQYSTGLHDKNGVEIFEGDKFAEFNAVVKFEKGAFWVIHDYHNERRPTLLQEWLDKRELARTGTEVIGNIYLDA